MLSWTAPACASTAAFPSSAHTYRLLIVKEPPPPSRPDLRRSRRCQIVLFVSSREMKLCGVSLFSSITIFRKLQNSLPHFHLPHLHGPLAFPAACGPCLDGSRTIASQFALSKEIFKSFSFSASLRLQIRQVTGNTVAVNPPHRKQ